ncbi:insulin-like growth factor-binding protein complex acid labile subunit [Phymastichus coffea]|uniref:insulin-like growth factor-binding protein complex acid labile subunit n=1 Tax=Phymastichus coffea TaxID=108790 RepID=UPI00273B8F8B|nr:insulin-like growth factor-binding protein complex acid labile subunit [Phymastichus coffea]
MGRRGRLLFLVAAAVLLLALAPLGDSACPSRCRCRDELALVECSARVPEAAWLDGQPAVRRLWLDRIQLPLLEAHARDPVASRFYRRQLEGLSLTRCAWPANESLALELLAKFVSRLANLRQLNVSRNALGTVDWCRDVDGPNITAFNASHNEISRVARDAFRGMAQLTELVLASNPLTHLPAALRHLRNLRSLDLSDNRIYKLDSTLGDMPELRRLNLAGNKISFLHGEYFRDARSLVELDISRNAFQFIQAESLQPFTSLSVLNLSENRLIERDLSLLLDSLRRLEVVDASRIGLWRVPATLTRSVKLMRLVGNQLTAINSGDFDSYPLLEFLDMSGNKLIAIEDDALGRLDDLEQLNLYGNILSSVPKSLPRNLRILDLRQNAIAAVNANDLRGLSKLRRLDLSGNVLGSIENGALRHLTALHELDVSDNPIKRLTSDALAGPQVLWRLRLAGLTEFKLDENQNRDAAFPYSQPEHLLQLDLSRSSSLAALFLADNATLSACKQLRRLDLSGTNIGSVRADLRYVLPELDTIVLLGNEFDCAAWTERFVRCRDHEFIEFLAEGAEQAASPTKPMLRVSAATTPFKQRATTLHSLRTSDFKSQMPKQFDMLVKPTATPPTTDLLASTIGSTRTAPTEMQTLEGENATPSTATSAHSVEERPDWHTPGRSIVVNKKLLKKTTPVEDNQNSQTTTRLPSTGQRKLAATMRTWTEEGMIGEDQPAIINLENDGITTTTYDEHFRSSNHIFSEFSRSKVLLANDEEQVSAEELINDRSQRGSEFFSSGTHPGMLILVGAVIGAAAALTVVLSRRATAKGREQYHRQENIALTPTTEQRW